LSRSRRNYVKRSLEKYLGTLRRIDEERRLQKDL
jgi:hypothetical protein